MNYDVIIPAIARNKSILEIALPYIEKNLHPKKIIIISKDDFKLDSKVDYQFVDENDLYQGLTYSRIREIIESRDKFAVKRTGWYLQQFLKYAYSYICEEDYYISWDADTIPLREIDMFEDGVPVFDIKEEYHLPYFTSINKLFLTEVKRYDNFSFISEHMIFKKEYVIQMLDDIEKNSKLQGMNVFEKILSAVNDIDLLMSGFSEFETYGNYVCNKFPDRYKIRSLKTLRDGDRLYGNIPTSQNLEEASKIYDIITFENRVIQSQKGDRNGLCKNKE